MPKQKVIIGNKIIESKDLEWENVLKTARVLKKIANWNPEEKYWKINWRLFQNYKNFISEIKEVLNDVDRDYLGDLERTLKYLMEFAPGLLEEGDTVRLLVTNCEPFKIRGLLKDAGITVKILPIEFNDIGVVEAPFIQLSKNRLAELVDAISKNDLTKCFKVRVDEIAPKSTPDVRVRVTPSGIKYLNIIIDTIPRERTLERIKRITTVKMFTSKIKEGLVEHEVRYYKIARIKGGVKISVPNYAFKKVLDILNQDYGKVEVDPVLNEFLKIRVNVSARFDLYDYQKEAFAKWKHNDYWGTIVIPTGGGKTYVALESICNLKVPAIIFVPNLWLLYQWVEKISEGLNVPKSEIGVLGGGEKKIKEITVSTYQTGYKVIDDIARKFPLVIFDEAHHVPANTFKRVALYMMAVYRMALSATPKRADGNEIMLFKLVGDKVYEIDYPTLVKKEAVSPLAVRKILVPLPREYLREYNKVKRKLSYAWGDLEKKQILNKLIEIARDNPVKLEVIKSIVKEHKSDKIFIFTGSISFAESVLKELKGIIPVAMISAKSKKSEEKRIIRGFIRGIYKALILVKKGEEGVDIGDASVAVIAGGSKQRRELIQRVGRVLRGEKGKLAWVYEIVTEKTIEEQLSRSRKAENLVKGLENYIKARFKVEPYKVIRWKSLGFGMSKLL